MTGEKNFYKKKKNSCPSSHAVHLAKKVRCRSTQPLASPLAWVGVLCEPGGG